MRTWHAVVAIGAVAVAAGLGVWLVPLAPSPERSPTPASSPPPRDEPAGRDAPSGPGPSARGGRAETATDSERCEPASLATRAGAVLVVGLPETTEAGQGAAASSTPLAAAEAAGVAGVFLTGSNVVDRRQVTSLIDDVRARLGDDVLVATDEETGRVSSFRRVVGATSSPRTSATRHDVDGWRDKSARIAGELAGLGVDWNFAPVADLDDGPPGRVIGDRSFSGDAAVATRYTVAFAEGHQRGGAIPTIKHFPGHGDPATDPHREPVRDDATLAELHAADLRPFVEAVRRGAQAVMVSHVTHSAFDDDLPASLAPGVYELLRDLGFAGVAVTDSVGMGAVHQRFGYAESAWMALAAGADAVLATDGRAAPEMVEGIVEAVERGDLDESRLDEAATRVLTLAGRDPEPITCQPPPPGFPDGITAPLPSDRR